MKIYKMPNGLTRQYEDGHAPDGAELLTAVKAEDKTVEEPAVETKAVEEIKNKAVTTPKNKKKGGSKK